jgi:putative nucleotidyltransferase with HDIG domain
VNLIRDRRYQAALLEADKMLERTPGFASALMVKGDVHFYRAEWDQAEAFYSELLTPVGGDYSRRLTRTLAKLRLANLYLAKGQFERALAFLDHAIDEGTAVGDRWGLLNFHYTKATILLAQGDLSAADAEIRRALEEAERDLDRRIREEVIEDETSPFGLDPEKTPFAVELPKARQIYSEAKTFVRDQFDAVGRGRRVDAEETHVTVEDLIESIFRNHDALLSLSRLKSYDEYTYHHSLNVAVLSLSLAVHLGILERELLKLGIGAVLHDLGKVRVPPDLIKKPGRLEDREFEVVKTHAAHGAKIILDARSIPLDCAEVPLTHHERFDGSGYPRGRSGLNVGKFGLITAIADVYDAMTTNRPYQTPLSPNMALRRTYEWAGSHFHPIYVRRFIQCVGIYPIGSVVELDTGERGVVARPNRADMLRPRVLLYRTAEGQPLDRPVETDLRDPDPREEKQHARTVIRVLEAGQAGVNLERILAFRGDHSESDIPSVAVA